MVEQTAESCRTLPDFLGIGAQRAGTSSIFACLREHPEVYTPTIKELHFFDGHYDKGMAWYKEFFVERTDETIAGEFSPNYLNHPDAIPRIAADLPSAKLIVMLRDPVERAWSAYKLFRSQGYFANQSFEEAMLPTSELVNQGQYAKHLERVFEYFPRRQVGIWQFNDFTREPALVMQQIYAWLGVDPAFESVEVGSNHNSSALHGVQERLQRWRLGFVWNTARYVPFARHVKDWLVKREAQKDDGAIERRQKYLHLFTDDMLHLEQLLDKDFSHWRRT